MTTPRTPRLDRLITMEGSVTSATFRFTTGFSVDTNSRTITVPRTDADGQTVMEPAVGSVVIFGYRNVNNHLTDRDLTVESVTSDTFNISFVYAPTFVSRLSGTPITLGFDATTPTLTFWAERRDFPARDQLEFADNFTAQVTDSRWMVRAGSRDWIAGDTFQNEGINWTVRGTAVLDRGRDYVELLARRLT